jgi:hypothetical protein
MVELNGFRQLSNIEQGNYEFRSFVFTSRFEIPCSIFDIRLEKLATRSLPKSRSGWRQCPGYYIRR